MCRLRPAWLRSETPISLTRHLLRAMPMPSWRAQDFWSPGHALSPKVVGAMPGTIARIPRVQRARRHLTDFDGVDPTAGCAGAWQSDAARGQADVTCVRELGIANAFSPAH